MNRRLFIEKSGRAFLLGGLALLSGLLMARRQVTHGSACSANFQCRSCRKLSGCSLPEAETERAYE